jgi:DNA primase
MRLMASGSVIETIKDRIDCREYLAKYVSLKARGEHAEGPCPFHSEKTASFLVWEDHAKCFGCGWRGDIFDAVQQLDNLELGEALRRLAQETGVPLQESPTAKADRERRAEVGKILRAAAELYHSLLTPEARAYLNGRGFKDAFIDSYLMGYAPTEGDVVGALRFSKAQLTEVGLINQRGLDMFRGRITIPSHGRYDDEITAIQARYCVFDADGKPNTKGVPKYLAAPSGDAFLIYERGLRAKSGRLGDGRRIVHLCEGDPDTATLAQLDLPVVGVRGTDGLKDEFAPKFEAHDTVYCWMQGDVPKVQDDGTTKAGAGEILAHRAGLLLGPTKVKIVVLPPNEDVNSFIGQQGNDWRPLAERAPTYMDWLIERLPEEMSPGDVERKLTPFIPLLAGLGKLAQDAYSKKLARRSGVSVVAIRDQMRDWLTRQNGNGNGNGHGHDGLKDAQIIWQAVPSINPVQDVIDGTVPITTVFLDKAVVDPEADGVKVETVPFVVTGKRDIWELTPGHAAAHKVRFPQTKVPSFSVIGQRWSTDEKVPHSVKAFVHGEARVAPTDVYSEVSGYFRKFLWYPNDHYHDFIALWTIGTYVYNTFQSYPYVHLNGTKQSGKSLTLEIINELAFNAMFSSSLSSASLYRTVESCSSTLLLDEAENLQKKKAKDKESDDDKLEILKAGYKKGGKVIRCTGDNHEPTGFDAYSPKMFGSIFAIDNILTDRTITLTLARKDKALDLAEFMISDHKPALHATRNKLYCWMLDFAGDIHERLRGGIDWGGVRNRDRELWTPILVLAEFFDDHLAHERGEAGLTDEERLLPKMWQLATQTVEERTARESVDQTEVVMIEGVLEYLRNHLPLLDDQDGRFYPSEQLLKYLQGLDGLGWVDDIRKVYRELEKATAVDRRYCGVKKRARGAGRTGPQTRCLMLDPEKIRGVAKRLGLAVTDNDPLTPDAPPEPEYEPEQEGMTL